MNRKSDDDLVERLKEVFNSVMPAAETGEYPKEAVPRGTYARSVRFDQLGVVTDPLSRMTTKAGKYFITNEYEYEIIAYLMMNPVNLDQFTASLGGELFYES